MVDAICDSDEYLTCSVCNRPCNGYMCPIEKQCVQCLTQFELILMMERISDSVIQRLPVINKKNLFNANHFLTVIHLYLFGQISAEKHTYILPIFRVELFGELLETAPSDLYSMIRNYIKYIFKLLFVSGKCINQTFYSDRENLVSEITSVRCCQRLREPGRPWPISGRLCGRSQIDQMTSRYAPSSL